MHAKTVVPCAAFAKITAAIRMYMWVVRYTRLISFRFGDAAGGYVQRNTAADARCISLATRSRLTCRAKQL